MHIIFAVCKFKLTFNAFTPTATAAATATATATVTATAITQASLTQYVIKFYSPICCDLKISLLFTYCRPGIISS